MRYETTNQICLLMKNFLEKLLIEYSELNLCVLHIFGLSLDVFTIIKYSNQAT